MLMHFLFYSQFPILYQEGVQNVLFRWFRILSWMFNGFITSLIIFYLCMKSMDYQAFNSDGKIAGLSIFGTTMYTCIVWVVNLQMALSISYFTLIQHVFIWGSIAIWYLFLLAYGSLSPTISTTAYKVLIEALSPAPSYWLITLFVSISALIPYFCCSAIEMRFFPMFHEMIQWIRYEGRSEDFEYCEIVRQRSLRPNTVGHSARLAAKRTVKAKRISDHKGR